MSWYSDHEPFNEYDQPYCQGCERGFSKEECDRCQAWHEEWEKESKYPCDDCQEFYCDDCDYYIKHFKKDKREDET